MIWEEANPARCPRMPMMSETNDSPAGEETLDLVEVETEDVDEDGELHAAMEDVTVLEADDEA